jgi:polyhydroxyalkanoate synthesis regulator phasin
VSAVPVEFAEGIERELAASKAEVERLRKQLSQLHEELCQAGLREYGN